MFADEQTTSSELETFPQFNKSTT